MRFDPATHTVHAAGRAWQADPACTVIEDRPWITEPACTDHIRRCRVRFESGWSASIIWGSGTYSANHDTYGFVGDHPMIEEPATVEVGVCDSTGQLRQRLHRDDDGSEWHDVEAYLDDIELAALLDQLAVLPTDDDYGCRPPTVAELYDAARAAGLDLPELDDR